MPNIGRLTPADRTQVEGEFTGHWAATETLVGAPILLTLAPVLYPTGFGLTNLQEQFTQYHSYQEQLADTEGVQLPNLRAQVTALWGTDGDDRNGLWWLLVRYRAQLRERLGVNHPLVKGTPPFAGGSEAARINTLDKFIKSWTRANAQVSGGPIMAGGKVVADLQFGHDALRAAYAQIDDLKADADQIQQNAEHLFGDVPATMRDSNSIITHLKAYQNYVIDNVPTAAPLPKIFPSAPSQDEPGDFAFNFRQQASDLVVWWQLPVGGAPAGSVAIALKEGQIEQSLPLPASHKHLFAGITAVGDLDSLEINDSEGRTLLQGHRDATLVEPA